jgi:CDP-glycerol glycerophosphotransferase
MKLINQIKNLRHDVYIELYRHMPIQKNKIILWANSFKQYGCNPKYITEYILQNYSEQFELVWVFESEATKPEGLEKKVRIVHYFSLEYLKELHTAKFVICNMRTGAAYHWKKRPEQIYIQTWHSSLRLKKIEGDAAEHFTQDYIEICKEDSRKIDLLLSGCRFSTDIFKRAFWYDGEIMECGTPRCDILLNNTEYTRRKVFAHYNLPEESKLILYAPTFRSNKPSDFLGMNFIRLKEVLGDNWIIGARLHPNVLVSVIPEGAVSMSKYPDMQELIAAADILITDFSSCMFDMAIAKKPCVLYAPDLEEYLEKERGLYFDIEKLPFPLAKDMDDLCRILSEFDSGIYQQNIEAFMKTIGTFEDGHATERVCEYICQKSK